MMKPKLSHRPQAGTITPKQLSQLSSIWTLFMRRGLNWAAISSLYTLLRYVLGARRHVGHKLRCSACTKVLSIDFHAEDPARRPAVAATICSSQWCCDARVLGPLPLTRWGLWVPSLVCNAHAGLRVPLGQDWQLGRSLFGMPAREL